jgi:sugar phosphate isomerase/epimerase
VIILSAFADEISSDLETQIEVLSREELRHMELRGVWDVGVLSLSNSQVGHLRKRLKDAGISVSAIASPVGKTPVDGPFESELRRLRRAIEVGRALDCESVRIFSFYPPSAGVEGSPTAYRAEAMRRVRVMIDLATEASVTLLHENDVGLYGGTISGCGELMAQFPDPTLAAALDPANYLLAGQRPFPDGYDLVRSRLRSIHVKDVKAGKIVPAGMGEARFPELLARLRKDGFQGVLALEPHLSSGGTAGGFSGRENFEIATRQLKKLLKDAELNWT